MKREKERVSPGCADEKGMIEDENEIVVVVVPWMGRFLVGIPGISFTGAALHIK
jgi:hypothetical protein